MTTPPIRNAAAVLLCCALAGCVGGLSPVDSRTGADPIPLFDRMVVVSATSDDGTNPEFPEMIDTAFHNAATRCGIKIDFVYERLDRKPVGPRHAATSGMELSIVPRVVFDDKSQSYQFNSYYGYIATLTDRSRHSELWKATFSIRPAAYWPRKGSVSLAAAIADPIFAQMSQDGVLHGCPPARHNGEPE